MSLGTIILIILIIALLGGFSGIGGGPFYGTGYYGGGGLGLVIVILLILLAAREALSGLQIAEGGQRRKPCPPFSCDQDGGHAAPCPGHTTTVVSPRRRLTQYSRDAGD